MTAIRFVLDGRPTEVSGVDPNTTLLHWLRANGRTGTKEGCAEGECGACAVAFVEEAPDGKTRYRATDSCLVLLPSVHGRELVTAQGISAQGEALHPVQEEMARAGGSQCGYCTPGFVVSLFAEWHRDERGPMAEDSVEGNLCRCTGYRPIRDAVHTLSELRTKGARKGDVFRQRLARAAPGREALRYEGVGRAYHQPTQLEDALELLAREPSLPMIAGGTDLVCEVNQRGRRFEGLLSVEAIEELRRFEVKDDAYVIGASVTLSELEEYHAKGALPLMEALLPLFASGLVRARATLGGNVATASPIGDGPPVLLALDAEVVLAKKGGERIVPLDEFFLGYRKTALAPGELIRAIRIPRPLAATQRFYKVSKRRVDDISTVAAGFAIDRDPAGVVTRARLAWGGVFATPVRTKEAEAALVGKRLGEEVIEEAGRLALAKVTPIDDHRGSAAYRRAMVPSLLRKFLADEG